MPVCQESETWAFAFDAAINLRYPNRNGFEKVKREFI
jgi:hypothetical protein